ncbi:C69 family dipeptidase [Terricaulis sp.]|uniref:C69 family dipeptidase n=1 Tax=Terricaulis sp. TaxID=2768686 RepID=UPI0037851520
MCDSFVVLPALTQGGAMLFAKNSDRERNEAQALEFHPRATHAPGATLKATYIDLPQAAQTHACILSRPYWMWGAEMGANEHGVVIGNEAMHSTTGAPETPALTGMDLLRLALERAASARAACDVITDLLERHGQGGDCGHLQPFYYHNGFLIADGREAYVLETVGRSWARQRVSDQRALSNVYSIGADYDAVSADLGREPRFDFAARFADLERDAQSFGRGRCARGAALLAANAGKHDVLSMMRILRDHGEEGEDAGWTPEHTRRRSICMHAAEGARRSQTTASMIAEWSESGVTLWVTDGAAPCVSIFKPLTFAATGVLDAAPLTERYDANTRWWSHERFHRSVLKNYVTRAAAVASVRDALEADFVTRVRADRNRVAACWRDADAAEQRWRTAPAAWQDNAYGQSWAEHDRLAGLPD